MSEVGSAYMSIIPKVDKGAFKQSTDDIKETLGQAGKDGGSSSGGLFGGAFQTTAGVFVGNMATKLAEAAGDGIRAIVQGAYDGYAEYEQLVGGMDTLYGSASQRMQENASNAFETAQMSANDYMDLATGFAASLVSSLGGDTEAAATYADMAISDMADNANKMGTSIEDIENAYRGFSKQNYTMLDNLKLGYGGTKSEMERLLSDAEALKAANGETVSYSIDSYADIVDAIHVVQESMGITGTTAEEAATTVQGSTATMQAAWDNWLTALGSGDQDMISSSLSDLIGSVDTCLQNGLPVLLNIVGGIVESVGSLLYDSAPPQVQGMIDDVMALVGTVSETLAPILEGIGGVVSSGLALVGSVIGVALDAIKLVWDSVWPAIQSTVEGVMSAVGPIVENALLLIQSVIDTVTALISGDWQGVWDGIQSVLQGAWDLMGSVVDGAINGVSSVIQGALSLIDGIWSGAWEGIGSILSSAWEGIQSAVSGGIDGVVEWVSGMPDRIVSALGDLGQTLWNAGTSIISGFLGGLKQKFDDVKDFVGGIGDWIAEHKGPLSYDRKLLVRNGIAVMQSLDAGLVRGFSDVKETVSGMAGELAGTFGSPTLSVGSRLARAAVAGSATGAAASRQTVVNQSFSTKVVRSDSDLYAAAPVIYRNAMREAMSYA